MIRAYIRLQRFRTNERMAFVGRKWECHGVAAGPILHYWVQGNSWAHIRRVLKTFEVTGHTNVNPMSVQAWTADTGKAEGKLHRISHTPGDMVPDRAQFTIARGKTLSVELKGFDQHADWVTV